MKKVICSMIFLLSISVFGILDVKAESIDVSRPSSLTVTYQYDTLLLTNVDVSLYYLAGIDASGEFMFTDEYQSVSFDTTDISASELTLQAEVIERYIEDNSLQSTSLLKTNQNGIANFSSLVPGLYLVTVDSKVVDNCRYDASPTIINIPTLENGAYQYDVKINIKTEKEELEQEVTSPGDNNSDNNSEAVPNTIDNIIFYVILLVTSIIIIFGVIIYILKKKGEKNEKKK